MAMEQTAMSLTNLNGLSMAYKAGYYGTETTKKANERGRYRDKVNWGQRQFFYTPGLTLEGEYA